MLKTLSSYQSQSGVKQRTINSCAVAMMLAGSSRPSSGAEHMFSHCLDELFPDRSRLHGVQVAFGTLITELLRGNDISSLMAIFQKVGLPTNFEDFGFDMQEVILIIQQAHNQRPDRFTILNMVPLDKTYLIERLTPLLRESQLALGFGDSKTKGGSDEGRI